MNRRNLDQKSSKKPESAEQPVTELEQISASSTSASSTRVSTIATDQTGTEHIPEIEISHSWTESLVQFLVDLAATGLVVYMAVEFGVNNLAVTGSITGAGIGGAVLLDGWHIHQKSQESSTYTNIARTLNLPELPKTYGQSFLASLGLNNRFKTGLFIISLIAVILLSIAIAKGWGNGAIIPLAAIGGGCFHLARRWFDSDVAKNIHTRQQQIVTFAAQSANGEIYKSNQAEIQRLQEAISDSEIKKAAFEMKYNDEVKENAKLSETNDKLVYETTCLNNKLNKSESDKNNVIQNYTGLSQQYSTLKEQKKELDIKYSAIEEKLTTANQQVSQKQLELSKQGAMLQQVLQEKAELLTRQASLLKEVKALNEEKQKLNDKIIQFEAKISQQNENSAPNSAVNRPRV